MERRTLLKAVPATGLLVAASPIARAQSATPAQPTGWRTFETVARIEIAKPSGQVRAWIPLPLSQDADYFRTLANSWKGNAETVEFVIDPNYRAAMAYATFKQGEAAPVLEVTSRFAVRERHVDLKPGSGMQATREELALYLKATELIPTDGLVKKPPTRSRAARAPTSTRRASSTTGPSRTRSAIPRPGAAAWATSRRCSRRRISAASAPT
jgi:hypothetical protein